MKQIILLFASLLLFSLINIGDKQEKKQIKRFKTPSDISLLLAEKRVKLITKGR